MPESCNVERIVSISCLGAERVGLGIRKYHFNVSGDIVFIVFIVVFNVVFSVVKFVIQRQMAALCGITRIQTMIIT